MLILELKELTDGLRNSPHHTKHSHFQQRSVKGRIVHQLDLLQLRYCIEPEEQQNQQINVWREKYL